MKLRILLGTIILLILFYSAYSLLSLKYIKTLPAPVNVGLDQYPQDNSEMILITEGKFIYGINKNNREKFFKNQNKQARRIIQTEFSRKILFLPNYYIDKYEITNEQYKQFIDETGYREPHYWKNKRFNRPKQPVVGIGWKDAEAYARWVGKRLPTEEEWEKAARGTDGRIWPWGNKSDGSRFNGKTQGYYAPVNVGTFKSGASPYGVMDMAGNVYEMTIGAWEHTGRVMRGGSYINYGVFTRTTFRWSPADEDNGAPWLGFRCVLDADKVSE